MNGYESKPLLPLPIIQPARNTSAANTKVHEPIPLRSLSAARSPRVNWSA